MRKILMAGFCFILFQIPVLSQGLFESIISGSNDEDSTLVSWNGFARGWLFGGSKKFDFSSVFSEFELQPTLDYKSSYVYADIRLRGGYQFGADTIAVQIKELYAGYHGNKLKFYLGNQIVQWGRTDGFNPTNNITPNDYFFLSAEPDDQKLSNILLRADYFLTPQIDFELIGIPVYKPSVYRYDLFTINELAEFIPARLPDRTFRNGAIAGRLNIELTRAGFSFSYFNGFDPFYGFRIEELDLDQPFPSIRYIPDFYRKQTFGGDFSLFLGSWILRGELAYNDTRKYTEYMYIPNPDAAYVFGLEHNLFGFTTIVQYVGEYTINFSRLQSPMLFDPSDPEQQIQYLQDRVYYESSVFNRKIFNQQEQFNHVLFVSINRSFAHELLQLELSGYYNVTSEEYLIRPSLKWRISDVLESKIGGSYMKGPKNSIFELSGPVLNGTFIELKASF